MNEVVPSLCIACDWGTSSLRMALVDLASNRLLAKTEHKSGIKAIYQNWEQQAPSIGRFSFYGRHLQSGIQALASKLEKSLIQTPLVISGMASSSIGIQELPYADLPFSLSQDELHRHYFPATESFPYPLYLISGLSKPGDVMRGEEVQAMGLAQQVEATSYWAIFPGTHSKHIQVRQNSIVHFHTYMTGEVFALLAQQSILTHSLEEVDIDDFPNWKQSFARGVKQGHAGHLTGSLFSIRAWDLQKDQSPTEAYLYLSGLMVGYELSALGSGTHDPIFICGSGTLTELYREAFRIIGLGNLLQSPGSYAPENLAFIGLASIARQIFQL